MLKSLNAVRSQILTLLDSTNSLCVMFGLARTQPFPHSDDINTDPSGWIEATRARIRINENAGTSDTTVRVSIFIFTLSSWRSR